MVREGRLSHRIFQICDEPTENMVASETGQGGEGGMRGSLGH